MPDQYIREFQYHLTVFTVVLLLLLYQVYYVQRKQIKDIQLEHESGVMCAEGFDNPYAARLQQFTDSGLTNPYVTTWGNVGGSRCPTVAQANSYLAKDELSLQDSFLGHHEPPVFYDIGDVRTGRSTRSQGGYSISKHGKVAGLDRKFAHSDVSTDQAAIFHVAGKDRHGMPIYCPIGQTLDDRNMCYQPVEKWESTSGEFNKMETMDGNPSDDALLYGNRR